MSSEKAKFELMVVVWSYWCFFQLIPRTYFCTIILLKYLNIPSIDVLAPAQAKKVNTSGIICPLSHTKHSGVNIHMEFKETYAKVKYSLMQLHCAHHWGKLKFNFICFTTETAEGRWLINYLYIIIYIDMILIDVLIGHLFSSLQLPIWVIVIRLHS